MMDKYETIEALKVALWNIKEAKEAIRPIEDDGGVFDNLDSIAMDVQSMVDDLRSEICAAEEAERAQEDRDYWKEVI